MTTVPKRPHRLTDRIQHSTHLTPEHLAILKAYARSHGISAAEALRRNIALMSERRYEIKAWSNQNQIVETCRTLQDAIEICDQLNRDPRRSRDYQVWHLTTQIYPDCGFFETHIDQINREAFPDVEES